MFNVSLLYFKFRSKDRIKNITPFHHMSCFNINVFDRKINVPSFS